MSRQDKLISRRLITVEERDRAFKAREELRRSLAAEMRSRVVVSSRAAKMMREIDRLSELIDAHELQEWERLNFSRIPFEKIREFIAIPLIADALNDVVTGVNATLREYGCSNTSFGLKSERLLKDAMQLVDALGLAEEGLRELVEHDDTLVDAIVKKTNSYIEQRLQMLSPDIAEAAVAGN